MIIAAREELYRRLEDALPPWPCSAEALRPATGVLLLLRLLMRVGEEEAFPFFSPSFTTHILDFR